MCISHVMRQRRLHEKRILRNISLSLVDDAVLTEIDVLQASFDLGLDVHVTVEGCFLEEAAEIGRASCRERV